MLSYRRATRNVSEELDDVFEVAQRVEERVQCRVVVGAIPGVGVEQLSVVIVGVSMSGDSKHDLLELLVSLVRVRSHCVLHSLQQIARSSDVERERAHSFLLLGSFGEAAILYEESKQVPRVVGAVVLLDGSFDVVVPSSVLRR